MSWGTRLTVAVCAAALALPGLAGTASAAVPSNDTPTGATAVTALPTTITQNTVGATTDAIDASLNCGAPATNGSVWFTYTATSDGAVLVDGRASDFTTGFFVTEGDPANGLELACSPGVAAFNATAGTTYYIVAFSDTVGVAGGNLSVTFDVAPPPPTLTATIDSRGTAFKDGTAQISGTYSCTGSAELVDFFGTLTQRIGRVKVVGYFEYFSTVCDGTTRPWTAVVTSDNGLFAGGKAASATITFACGLVQCTDGYIEQTIQLSKGTVKG